MSLNDVIVTDLKTTMKAKDKVALRGIRAIKAALLLAQTDGSGVEITEELEIKILQKLVKQRKESYDIYIKQDRNDLAQVEKEEIEIIQKYLPAQMNPDDIRRELVVIIANTNANGMKDMGKVMGVASKSFAGKADGKILAGIVRELLTT